jgi:hypothetical protein
MAPLPKKRPFLSPRFALPLGTVLALIAGFVVYYFVIITHQEASVDDRALRSLAAVSAQFRDLVSTYGTVFQGASAVAKTNHPAQGRVDAKARNSGILGFLAAQGSKLAAVDDCGSSPSAAVLQSEPGKSWVTASAVPRTAGYSLEIAANGWCAHVPFESVLPPLIADTPSQIFDDVILTDESGTVLYQTRRSPVIVDDLALLPLQFEGKASAGSSGTASKGEKDADSSADTKVPSGHSPAPKNASPFSGASESSNVFLTTLAGASYRAYLVPVRLPVPRPSASGTRVGVRFVLCGLMLQKHFATQSRSLPLTALAAIALAVILVIVGAWPLLKFSTMRRSEEITRWAGFYYATSVALTVTVMILLVTHLYYGFSDPKTDNNMEDLAKAIDKNVGQELNQALLVMDSVGASAEVKNTPLHTHKAESCTDSSDDGDLHAKTDLLKSVGMEVSEYPYFRRLFVYDSKGFEQVRWTVDAQPPPTLRVCDRPYFQGVQRNDLWYLSDQGLSGARFRVDPLYSKSTGEYLAAIARPYKIGKRGKVDAGVMTMVTPLLALIAPVLPPDYGFAVIDSGGKVLFHSDTSKNGRENFFDELGDSRTLRAAVLARRPNWLRETYLGGDYGLFVTPFTTVQGCPWSLLVFSNRAVLGDKELERTVLLALLCGMYLAILVGTAALLRLCLPCHRMAWPMESMKGCYCHLALVFGFVIILTYALIFQASPKELLCFTVLIPATAAGFSILRLQHHLLVITWVAGVLGCAALLKVMVSEIGQRGGWKGSPYLTLALICAAYLSLGVRTISGHFDNWKRPSLATAYSLGCFALLILAAGLPCIAFFKFSYDYDESLATRRQQLLTLSELNRREQRVVGQYFQVNISGETGPFADDLGKWLFLRRRLQEQKLDRYDKAFRDQRAGQIMVDSQVGQWPDWWVYVARNWIPRRSESLAALVAEDCLEGSQWRWSVAGANRIRLQPSYEASDSSDERQACSDEVEANRTTAQPGRNEQVNGSPETLALRKLAMQDPIFLAQDLTYHVDVLRPWDFLRVTWFTLAVLLVAMFFSVRSTMTKMFLLKWSISEEWGTTTLAEAVMRGSHAILVGLPCSGKTAWLTTNAATVGTIDVATASGTGTATATPIQALVALDHFEYGMADGIVMRWKLALLEQLASAGKKILIVTTVDPEFYFENAAEGATDESPKGGLDAPEATRWARILGRLKETWRLTGGSQPDAKAYYHQLLWSTCTFGEKIALHPLAEEGRANHKNVAALQHLWNRGLIASIPQFCLTDPEFGKYVSEKVTKPERKAWQLRDTSGVWDGLRTTLVVLLLGGLAVVLFFSQKDILGIVTGAIGALTAATKIVSEFRGPRLGGGKGGTEAA